MPGYRPMIYGVTHASDQVPRGYRVQRHFWSGAASEQACETIFVMPSTRPPLMGAVPRPVPSRSRGSGLRAAMQGAAMFDDMCRACVPRRALPPLPPWKRERWDSRNRFQKGGGDAHRSACKRLTSGAINQDGGGVPMGRRRQRAVLSERWTGRDRGERPTGRLGVQHRPGQGGLLRGADDLSRGGSSRMGPPSGLRPSLAWRCSQRRRKFEASHPQV